MVESVVEVLNSSFGAVWLRPLPKEKTSELADFFSSLFLSC